MDTDSNDCLIISPPLFFRLLCCLLYRLSLIPAFYFVFQLYTRPHGLRFILKELRYPMGHLQDRTLHRYLHNELEDLYPVKHYYRTGFNKNDSGSFRFQSITKWFLLVKF